MGSVRPGRSESAGLLILDGLLLAKLDAGRAHVGWLLGDEDLIRPWDLEIGLTQLTAWEALTPTRVALIDADFVRRAALVPGIVSELLFRAERTSQWLLAKSLLLSSPTVEDRLMLLFALLGERWGKVTREGVHLRLRLTHALIAYLVGARRPTVSATLKALQEKGLITRDTLGGWVLCPGDPAKRPTCWPAYADALGFSSGS